VFLQARKVATVRVHCKLRQAGAIADLHVFEGQSHAQFAGDPDAPERSILAS
jgi:hypothetical protein